MEYFVQFNFQYTITQTQREIIIQKLINVQNGAIFYNSIPEHEHTQLHPDESNVSESILKNRVVTNR